MAVLRFIRFKDEQGTVHYGEPSQNDLAGNLVNASVRLLDGNPFDGLKPLGIEAKVSEVLSPLERTPLILCIGLNYKRHAEEANLQVTPYPVVFTKPPDALTGPYHDIHVHPDAASKLDYEGELTVVMGKDGKNIPEDEALGYVLGYTIGNDVSARNFQLPHVSGGQFCYAKSFDGFAPIGPAITLAGAIPDPQRLSFVTRVDGVKRQETSTDDMIWSVRQIIAHLSRGTTLRKGTLIMTGTPSGVGLFTPNGFLHNGSVVEVELDKMGTIKNRIVFD
ncbi:fumarylacetoacetate hydrolase family protein [Aspergillus terreus]|uniref:Fumarylacetoacetate hydrolase family protein n=1 Tax=Aspergillus terreus TaxID=33178 RepID=A0A5M3YPU5_ASPTE|nr:hypothetical protein ATETN484_0002064900 [Aspergillus terreus]GFF15505.1 fumarylacetoacetate hydrolase family protein [Aspergillus terreus]